MWSDSSKIQEQKKWEWSGKMRSIMRLFYAGDMTLISKFLNS